MKTVFITGASSGIGKETAKFFQKKGWNVVATMRRPELEHELTKLEHVTVIRCDVTEEKSRNEAIKEAVSRFGQIHVLVNNAGYYTVGTLEEATTVQIERQLDTNLLGVIEMTRAILPHFRENREGVIINLSSIAGVVSIPLQSLYHATKFGIEGFSESLQYELSLFGIRVKLIEPGTIYTEFCGRSMTVTNDETVQDYKEYSSLVISNLIKNGNAGSTPEIVAKTIYKAATDGKKKMRYKVGKMKNLILLRKMLPTTLYQRIVSIVMQS